MKKSKAPRVPVLEQAFEVNLPKLVRAVKASGRREVVLVDGDEHTVAMLTDARLAIRLGGRTWMADIVTVPCLNGRLRPLLKCPRAHEGNFQALYWRGGELACRHCHRLRYSSTLAAGATARASLARIKLLDRMGGLPSDAMPTRPPRTWHKRYRSMAGRLVTLTGVHYSALSKSFINSSRPSLLLT